MRENSNDEGFTLIELLVVIAILGVLAAAVTLVINPVELLAQSRDAERISDIDTLRRSLNLYQVQSPGTMPGSTSTLYISITDSSSTCGGLGLPSLPSGWTYGCSANPGKIDSTGWVPVNLGSIVSNSISALPMDPTNSASLGLYYTYAVSGPQYEITALLESQKYRTKEDADAPVQDYPGVLAEGSSLSISPLFNPSGLIGYWNFNEGSGTTASDVSGNGNDGTLMGGATWVNGKYGSAVNVSGGSHVEANDPGLNNVTSFTLAAWVNYATIPNAYPAIITRNTSNVWDGSLFLAQSGGPYAGVQTGNSWKPGTTNLQPGQWYEIVATYDGSNVRLYVNGAQEAQYSYSTALTVGTKVEFGYTSGYPFNGSIDDVRIYNRTLSASEVQALYNSEK